MSLELLTSLIPPPATPRCAPADAEVRSLEEQLGITFPQDYVRMCQRYGRGTFCSTCTGVSLALPAERYLFHLETTQIRLSPARKPNCPYRAFPARPGLLPWAFDEGDAEVYWLVGGASADWSIVTRLAEQYDDDAFQRFEMSATEFLAQAFSYRIEVALWDPLRFGHDEQEAAKLRRESVRFEPR